MRSLPKGYKSWLERILLTNCGTVCTSKKKMTVTKDEKVLVYIVIFMKREQGGAKKNFIEECHLVNCVLFCMFNIK